MRILKIRKSVERRSQLLPIKEYLTGENFCLDEFMDMVSRMEKMGLLSRCRPIASYRRWKQKGYVREVLEKA